MDAINQAVMARQPEYPPQQSMGGINAYNFACKPIGYSPGYCVCLHKIAAYERDDGKLASYPECEKAIRNNDCPALKMRAEEQAAGKALYFLDRNLLREEMDKHFSASIPKFRSDPKPFAGGRPAPKKAQTPQVAPQVTPQAALPEDGYAAAINAAIAESATESPKEEPTPTAPSGTEEPKRMSMIDKARAQMGK